MGQRGTRQAAIGLAVALLLIGVAACGERPEPPSERTLAWRAHVAPFFASHCVDCHGGAEPEGGLSFESWAGTDVRAPELAAMRGQAGLWERLVEHVQSGVMPPPEVEAPPGEAQEAFLGHLGADLETAWREAPPDPGRVTVRRLSRYEYRNTVRDLLGVDFDADASFPTDDVGYGFDHIGDVLSMPPMLFEKYMTAAEQIAAEALPIVDPNHPRVHELQAEDMTPTGGGKAQGSAYVLYAPGEIGGRVHLPRTATYRIRVRAWAQQAGPEPARMQIMVGGLGVHTVDVPVNASDPQVYEVKTRLPMGRPRVAAAFVNDYYKPKHPDPTQRDRNLWVDWIEVEGPLGDDGGPRPASERKIIVCEPTPGEEAYCTSRILHRLLRRAWRRPPRVEEVHRLADLAAAARRPGEPFEVGIQAALQAILVSPQFLFRVELDSGGAGRPYAINDHELASRLAYFLWSSLPDEKLSAHADARTLRSHLSAEVDRMLADPKARALVENFAAQWLELRRLETASPDPKRFKDFDEALRRSMQTETRMFVAEIFRDDRSILDLLDAPFTYLDERLARHYGIAGVRGAQFRRHELDGQQRGGLLGHASILTLTSYPTRTSPTQRGKWLLEEILGAPPPPPPPGVGVLESQAPEMLKLSLRERLKVHREDPSCAVCHAKMDVLGFGLENYDAVGAWRTKDGHTPIDVSGTLPDGRAFARPSTLRAILRDDPGFPRCFAEKLLTYATGRGLERYDRSTVKVIAAFAAKHDFRFRSFVHAVVTSDAFTMRRAAGDAP